MLNGLHMFVAHRTSRNNSLLNAGDGDSAWEAAEPPAADNAGAQPTPGREPRLTPVAEAALLPAAAVVSIDPDLEIPAAELVELLLFELEDNFCCPLTLVCI